MSLPRGEQPGQLIDIESGNAAFDQKFKNNPIDQRYLKEDAGTWFLIGYGDGVGKYTTLENRD